MFCKKIIILLIIIFFIYNIKKYNKNLLDKFDNRSILNLKESNNFIIERIKSNKPFIISRIGSVESRITKYYLLNKEIDTNQLNTLSNNAGIYDTTNNNDSIKEFCILYSNAIKKSCALAYWDSFLKEEQSYFVDEYKLTKINTEVLEPFYIINENIKPWSNWLLDKTILIIHPFVESFKIQLKNNFKFFKNENEYIFHPKQKLIFYKSFNTAAGNHIHKTWFETYKIMCKDISKLNFDIALLGCGGYGHPLCYYIFKDLNKSAIYVGGGLQLIFGVMGKRWETNDKIQAILKNNDSLSNMIRPSKNEILKNNKKIEGGCYW